VRPAAGPGGGEGLYGGHKAGERWGFEAARRGRRGQSAGEVEVAGGECRGLRWVRGVDPAAAAAAVSRWRDRGSSQATVRVGFLFVAQRSHDSISSQLITHIHEFSLSLSLSLSLSSLLAAIRGARRWEDLCAAKVCARIR
jgi:hypothetical protein